MVGRVKIPSEHQKFDASVMKLLLIQKLTIDQIIQRQQWDLEFELLLLMLLLLPSDQKPLMREGCAGTRSVTPQERSDEESEGDSRSPKQPDPSAIMRMLSPQTVNQTGGILLKLGWPRERVLYQNYVRESQIQC